MVLLFLLALSTVTAEAAGSYAAVEDTAHCNSLAKFAVDELKAQSNSLDIKDLECV